MKTTVILAASVCLAAKTLCGPSPTPQCGVNRQVYQHHNLADLPAYRYDSLMVTSSEKFDHPAPAADKAYVRIVYPVFEDDNLNNLIKTAVLAPLTVKHEFKNAFITEHPALSNVAAMNNSATGYHELADSFLQKFECQAPEESLNAYWYANIKIDVIADSEDYTAAICSKDYFTGGLHDLYDHIYLNYDNRNHQLITLASQLKPGCQDQLKTIAERLFRKNEGLTPAQQLDGYFFQDGKFDLPANFTFTDKGLLFFYDYYEIKPFAAGTTKLVVPYYQLKDMVLPGSVLASQMGRRQLVLAAKKSK